MSVTVHRGVLTQDASVSPHLGSGAYGEKYGPALAELVPCRLEPTRRVVTTGPGKSVVATALLVCLPGAPVGVQDRVTVDGTAYLVVGVATERGRHRPHHLEVLLA